jgi:hypothetical protein
MADDEASAGQVQCKGCGEWVRPQVANVVCLTAATIVTVHGCPKCEGREATLTPHLG